MYTSSVKLIVGAPIDTESTCLNKVASIGDDPLRSNSAP